MYIDYKFGKHILYFTFFPNLCDDGYFYDYFNDISLIKCNTEKIS